MTKKKLTFRLLITGLVALFFLLWVGFFFFSQKAKKEENQVDRGSLAVNTKKECSNCKKEVSTKGKFCERCGESLQNLQSKKKQALNIKITKSDSSFCLIKIQKVTSGKYFVNWKLDKKEGENNAYFEEGENVFSAERMPEILTEYQEC